MVRREMHQPFLEDPNRETVREESPKKMAEMNAEEFENAVLQGDLDLAKASVFGRAIESLGGDHRLITAILRIKNSEPNRAERIREVVEHYKQAKEGLAQAQKELQQNKETEEDTAFKKAA